MNLRKYLKKKNYLLQLFVTIAGFVCIPLILTQILMLERSANGFSKLSEDSIYESLIQGADIFEEKLSDMSVVAFEVGLDEDICKAAKAEASAYEIYTAANRLHDFDRNNWTTGILFCNKESVIFDGVYITPERLFVRLAGEDAQYSHKVESFFRSVDHLSVTSTIEYNLNGVIIVARSVSVLSSKEADAIVFFVLDHGVLEKEFTRRFHDCAGVALMDEGGRFVLKSDVFSAEMCETAEFQAFLQGTGRTSFEAVNGKDKIAIYKYRDADTGHVYLVSVFKDGIDAQLSQYVSAIRNILIVSVVLIFILLGLTVRINYKPILKMINKHGDKAVSKELSELELLESAFFAVDQKIISKEKMLTNFLISDLLAGKTVDEKLAESSFGENANREGVVIALDGPAITAVSSNRITEMLKLKCGCDSWVTGIIYRPQIILVCVLHSQGELVRLRECLEGVLWEVTGQKYRINYGQVVGRITEIRTSYLQSLLDSNASSEGVLNDEVEATIKRFGESVQVMDVANAQRLLDTVESQFILLKENESQERYYCYKLLTVYFAEAKNAASLKGEMQRLITFRDTKQLFVMLRQSIRKLCVKQDEGERERTAVNKLGKKLIDYVDENFNDRNLCLTMAADYMETSIYAVSRLFKEVTGKGFKEYITEKRLEHARELLESTMYSVNEISDISGFENTVYFSTVFKRKYGMPPTQYRKKH